MDSLTTSLAEVAARLAGKKITYTKIDGSSRKFTIVEITTFDRAKSTGKMYIRAKMLDHDDGLAEVERTLHLEGIDYLHSDNAH